MQDKFLLFFGTICSPKSLAYGKIDRARLPDEVNALLQSYKQVVIALCVAVLLPVFLMNKLTILLAIPLAALCYVLKLKFEKKLDPLLAPYMKGGDDV